MIGAFYWCIVMKSFWAKPLPQPSPKLRKVQESELRKMRSVLKQLIANEPSKKEVSNMSKTRAYIASLLKDSAQPERRYKKLKAMDKPLPPSSGSFFTWTPMSSVKPEPKATKTVKKVIKIKPVKALKKPRKPKKIQIRKPKKTVIRLKGL